MPKSDRDDSPFNERFKEGQELFYLPFKSWNWDLNPAIVRKVTAKQVKIQEDERFKKEGGAQYTGSTWTLTGDDVKYLFRTRQEYLEEKRERIIEQRRALESKVMELEHELHEIEAELSGDRPEPPGDQL